MKCTWQDRAENLAHTQAPLAPNINPERMKRSGLPFPFPYIVHLFPQNGSGRMPSVAELYAKNYGHLFEEQYTARQVIEGKGRAVVSEPHLEIVCVFRTSLGY